MADALDAVSLTERRYSRVAMWLHWIIAALIISNLVLGIIHEDFEKPTVAWIMFFHKSIGMTVLGLSILRLLWRLGNPAPPHDKVLHAWERALATATHWTFYFLMIAIPLSGWLLSSTGARITDYFGLFPIGPLPISQSHESHELWETAHKVLSFAMIGLLLLHVAGAIKHYVQGYRHVTGRMAPWLAR